MKRTAQAVGLFVIIATSALAHQGVQNPTVKARMDAMSAIGKNTKILGAMAKGEVAFNKDAARAAADAIAKLAAQIPGLFQVSATDPKSEALPAIWQTYGDFSAKADALDVAAAVAARDITTLDNLRPALAAIGGACKSCHQDYRQKK